jgi:hypothetical protein
MIVEDGILVVETHRLPPTFSLPIIRPLLFVIL